MLLGAQRRADSLADLAGGVFACDLADPSPPRAREGALVSQGKSLGLTSRTVPVRVLQTSTSYWLWKTTISSFALITGSRSAGSLPNVACGGIGVSVLDCRL
jgi:hypothetical protein